MKKRTKEKYKYMKETDSKLKKLKADKSPAGRKAYKARKMKLNRAAKAQTTRKLGRMKNSYKTGKGYFKGKYPTAMKGYSKASKWSKVGKVAGYVGIGLQIGSLIADIIMQEELNKAMEEMSKNQEELQAAYDDLAIKTENLHNLNLVVMRVKVRP